MKIEKITLSDISQNGKGHSIISRITYVQSAEYEKFDEINRRVAENLLAFCKDRLCGVDGVVGSVVALLTPTVCYVDDTVISIKYDFTVSSDRKVVHHKRFCINMLYELGVFLLPSFLSGKKRIDSCGSFYLSRGEGGEVLATPVIKSIERGAIIGRRSEIDAYCDGEAQKVKIKIAHFLTCKTVRKN